MPRRKQAQAAPKPAADPIVCACGAPHNRQAHGVTLIGTVPHFRCQACGIRNPRPRSTRPAAADISTR